MRNLVYTGFMSLDGIVDSPGGGPGEDHRSGGWVFKDLEFVPAAWSLKGEELTVTTALMFGRRSYEAFAAVWPGSEDHVGYKALPKYVVSTTLSDDALVPGWGLTTILRSTEDVAALKEGEGGAIYIHGSAELARRLSDAGLIDQYNLLVFPVLARCREEPVRPSGPGQAHADAAGIGELLERDSEAGLRRQALIPRSVETAPRALGRSPSAVRHGGRRQRQTCGVKEYRCEVVVWRSTVFVALVRGRPRGRRHDHRR